MCHKLSFSQSRQCTGWSVYPCSLWRPFYPPLLLLHFWALLTGWLIVSYRGRLLAYGWMEPVFSGCPSWTGLKFVVVWTKAPKILKEAHAAVLVWWNILKTSAVTWWLWTWTMRDNIWNSFWALQHGYCHCGLCSCRANIQCLLKHHKNDSFVRLPVKCTLYRGESSK